MRLRQTNRFKRVSARWDKHAVAGTQKQFLGYNRGRELYNTLRLSTRTHTHHTTTKVNAAKTPESTAKKQRAMRSLVPPSFGHDKTCRQISALTSDSTRTNTTTLSLYTLARNKHKNTHWRTNTWQQKRSCNAKTISRHRTVRSRYGHAEQ